MGAGFNGCLNNHEKADFSRNKWKPLFGISDLSADTSSLGKPIENTPNEKSAISDFLKNSTRGY